MKEKILIIDDEIDICQIFKDLLEFEEPQDYEVDYVTTAEEAFERLKSNQYRIAFVDIKLSGTVSGIDIIKSCRRLDQRPTIVVISAIPERMLEPVFEKEAIRDLVYGFYEKTDSLTPDVLDKLIHRLLNR